jgi:hypothetical protein
MWSQTEVETLLRLRGEGETWKSVAARMNRSPQACQNKFFALRGARTTSWWTKQEIKRLADVLCEFKQLGETEVNWAVVAREVGPHKTKNQCAARAALGPPVAKPKPVRPPNHLWLRAELDFLQRHGPTCAFQRDPSVPLHIYTSKWTSLGCTVDPGPPAEGVQPVYMAPRVDKYKRWTVEEETRLASALDEARSPSGLIAWPVVSRIMGRSESACKKKSYGTTYSLK